MAPKPPTDDALLAAFLTPPEGRTPAQVAALVRAGLVDPAED